jgi:peptidoglycan glycosyltransferase
VTALNRQVRWLALAMAALFVALFAQLNWIQLVQAGGLRDHPANNRQIVRTFTDPRGVIQTADGVVLAQSVPSNDSFERQRVYPEGPLFAHVTGYFSFEFGAEGVEKAYNDELAGRTDELELTSLGDWFLGRRRTADVTLSLTKRVQQVAAEQLGNRPGSVVAVDPRTGAVLAMHSFPSYDPNVLAGHDLAAVRAARGQLTADPSKPLLHRSYRERYFPGSTFKVVTATGAVALGREQGPVTQQDPVYPTLRELDLPQTNETLSNFGRSSCGGALPHILQVSCNTAFAQLGLEMGGGRLNQAAGQFGFNQRPPLDLSPGAVSSVFPEPDFFPENLPLLAQAAIGQNNVAATPLQMALVAAGIANGGTVMRPQVMAEVRDSEGEILRRLEPEPWTVAASPAVAAQVRDMMVAVVNGGTAGRAAIPGVQVAAKTGTAQTGRDTSHAWLIAFAPADSPRVAVAVIVEGQSGVSEATGGRVAAPIARAVMEAVLALPDPVTAPPAS